MRPQSAKQKGARLQKYVRDKLLEIFKQLEPDDVKSTSMGAGGEDIQLSPAARRLIPYQIECKNKAVSQIHTYYDQAKTHGKHEPLVIVHKDRDIYLAIVSLDHFLQLLQQLKGNNEGT